MVVGLPTSATGLHRHAGRRYRMVDQQPWKVRSINVLVNFKMKKGDNEVFYFNFVKIILCILSMKVLFNEQLKTIDVCYSNILTILCLYWFVKYGQKEKKNTVKQKCEFNISVLFAKSSS